MAGLVDQEQESRLCRFYLFIYPDFVVCATVVKNNKKTEQAKAIGAVHTTLDK